MHIWIIDVLQLHRIDLKPINGETFSRGFIVFSLFLYGTLSWLLEDDRRNGFAIKYGLRAKCELTCMYLDDIKMHACTDNHLRGWLRIVGIFSRDIRGEFGLDKPFVTHGLDARRMPAW